MISLGVKLIDNQNREYDAYLYLVPDKKYIQIRFAILK